MSNSLYKNIIAFEAENKIHIFYISQEATKKAFEFEEKHREEKHKNQYCGAIGGMFTYTFTMTSIGTIAGVQCYCGEKISLDIDKL